MITRNRRTSVLRTLDALAALPERPPVIVVDNGSDDRTLRAVRRHPVAARVLRPGRNTGALGRSLAVRHARTSYVAFSDDDSWWEPGSLGRAADVLEAQPRLGLVAARTLVGPDGTDDPLNDVLAASPLPPEPDPPGRPVLGFLGCACVVRRDAFLAAGGYHPVLFFGGEETLLAYDLAACGWGVAYEPSLTARHHPEPSHRADRGHVQLRNEILTLWLRRPVPVALRASVRLTAAALTGRSAARPALRGVLTRLPAALARRRRLPPHVERVARLLDGPAPATTRGGRPVPVALRASVRLTAAALTGRSAARPALRGVLTRLPAALARRRRLPPHVERVARLLDGPAPATTRGGRPVPVALRASVRLTAAALTGRSAARPALRGVLTRLPAALARPRRLPPHVERVSRLLDGPAPATTRGTASA